jgi:hypothetical protein
MKKIVILIVLVTAYSNIFALLTQANWRWRNDDGTETTATWKAPQNTQALLSTKGEIWRLRLELYNNAGSSLPFLDTLQYATSTAGPWTNIDVSAGSKPFMIADTNVFVVQDAPTTAQLAGTAYTFAAGKIMVDSMVVKNLNLADLQRTEIEWAIKSTPNIIPNTVYYFREQWGTLGGFSIDAGATYPSLLTLGVLSVKLSVFTVSREGQKIKLEWVSALQNSARFEVQRSSDGRTWKTIASIKGGSSAASNAYKIYDESPLNGINYYVIKQYDVDGHSYLSNVKFLRMPDIKPIISVYPNPAHSGVNFNIVNKGANNLEAILTNINGTIIDHEIFQSVPANKINRLNLQQQPAPGVYILKLKAEGISESVRVVIE